MSLSVFFHFSGFSLKEIKSRITCLGGKLKGFPYCCMEDLLLEISLNITHFPYLRSKKHVFENTSREYRSGICNKGELEKKR